VVMHEEDVGIVHSIDDWCLSARWVQLFSWCSGFAVKQTTKLVVDGFTYLGSRIDKSGDAKTEVNIRIGKASVAFGNWENMASWSTEFKYKAASL
jgi:hypothetical protein